MAIPDGTFYQSNQLGNGSIGNIETAAINSETAGGAIAFGQGVNISGGKVVAATAAPIYGVALKRTYVNSDEINDSATDAWAAGETVGVLRDGTVAVPLTGDVNKGDSATVSGAGFKTAGASDAVVGTFLTTASNGGTALLQTRVQLAQPAAPQTGSSTGTGK